MNLLSKKMQIIGGPKTEAKADKQIDKYEAKRNRLSKKISMASPSKAMKLRDKIAKAEESTKEVISKIKEKGSVSQYAEDFLKGSSMEGKLPKEQKVFPKIKEY